MTNSTKHTKPNAADMTDAENTVLSRLQQGLVTRAEQEQILDIAYRFLDSPVGTLLIAATTAGVVRVAFDVENHDDVLSSLAETISPRIIRDARRTDEVAKQIDAYFAKGTTQFHVALDLQLVRGFRHTVLTHLPEVTYGTTASYAALATLAGKPTAFRAAATACSHNPLPIVLPCHRIVKSDGSVGRYLGGDDRKRLLLALEQS
jgi:methylated-DNA-[protein]-cysteine S-methyltransferase